jgi:hypothetical protein
VVTYLSSKLGGNAYAKCDPSGSSKDRIFHGRVRTTMITERSKAGGSSDIENQRRQDY